MSLANTRIVARLLAVAALAALTAGCFQPMYAEHADGTPGLREKLMGVEVPPVDKKNASRGARTQVEMRNALAFQLYGPEAGLVRERAAALLASAVDDPNDPFSLVRLDGDELSAEPSRLVDEAMTVPLFGGRRAIRVRAGSRSFAGGIDTLAEMPLKDCRIVIEAGELRAESPLRKACERAKTAVAIACYPDTERDLAKLIDDELRPSSLRIAPDARAVLTALLGGDRQASRNELRKLGLYAHGKGEVSIDDVMAVVADASELKLDPIGE